MARKAENPMVRLMRKITVNPTTQCWDYTGCTDRDGYGKFKVNGQSLHPHRWMFIQAVGPLAPGFEVDHLCQNRRCCNPCHHEAVPAIENKLRVAQPDRRTTLYIDRDLTLIIAS